MGRAFTVTYVWGQTYTISKTLLSPSPALQARQSGGPRRWQYQKKNAALSSFQMTFMHHLCCFASVNMMFVGNV